MPAFLLPLAFSTLLPFPPQEARAPFDAASVQLDPGQGPFRRLLDFDLDGDLDAIGGHVSDQQNSYRLWSYVNDGTGAFEEVWYEGVRAPGGYWATFGQGEFLVEVGRRDPDALPDVEVFLGLFRFTWRGLGDGTFQNTGFVEMPRRATGLALADLDGDGLADLVWSDTQRLNVLTTLGLEGSISHGSNVSATTHLWLDVLPAAGPGGLDVILLTTPTALKVFHRSAEGLLPGPVFPHATMKPMCDTGDVDGDGDVDAVLFGMTSYRVLRRSDPGTWDLESAVEGGPAQFLADVDGDGDLDGACCGGGGNPISYEPNVKPTAFEIALNDGTGAFARAFAIPGLGSPELAGVADVDLDGDADLVAGRCVYFSRGAIRPVAQWDGPPAELVRNPRSLSDFDSDGDLDVGLSLDSVRANDGRGRFDELLHALAPPPAGTRYSGPGFTGDFNGDGDTDLLVELHGDRRAPARLGRNQGVLGMWLLENDGSGSFPGGALASEPGVSFALDSLAAEASLVVDLDRDGDLDLLTRAMAGPSFTAFWLNDGLVRFRAAPSLAGARAEWAGDLDLDGDVDLLASEPGAIRPVTCLYLGSSQGVVPSFIRASMSDIPFDPVGGGVAEGDYYGPDGYPDFAVTMPRAIALPNFFPRGGSIGATIALDGGHDLKSDARVALADVNGDGLTDGLIGTLRDDPEPIAEVHLRTGTAWVHPDNFRVALQLLAPGQLVDLDQDGNVDVLAERIVLHRTALSSAKRLGARAR